MFRQLIFVTAALAAVPSVLADDFIIRGIDGVTFDVPEYFGRKGGKNLPDWTFDHTDRLAGPHGKTDTPVVFTVRGTGLPEDPTCGFTGKPDHNLKPEFSFRHQVDYLSNCGDVFGVTMWCGAPWHTGPKSEC